MQTFDPEFSIVEVAVTIIKTDPSVAYRLYFGAGEHDASLQPVFNGILESGRTVLYVDIIRQSGSV